jgi:hypothetical protein
MTLHGKVSFNIGQPNFQSFIGHFLHECPQFKMFILGANNFIPVSLHELKVKALILDQIKCIQIKLFFLRFSQGIHAFSSSTTNFLEHEIL